MFSVNFKKILYFCTGIVVLTVSAISGAETIKKLLILDSQFGNPYDEVRASLLNELETQGYVEGTNLKLSIFSAANDVKTGEQLLKNHALSDQDAVFVGGTVATMAAKNILMDKKVPVIFGSPTDPIGIGVIDNFLDPPKSNFTGVCYPVPLKARFRFIRQLLPEAKVFALIYADMPQSHSYNEWIKTLLKTDPEFKDITIIFKPVPLITGEDGDSEMAELSIPIIKALNDKVDAFIKPNDQLGTRRHFSQVVWKHADKPLIGIVKNDVMAHWGATAVIYPSHQSIGQQTGQMIAELFDGQSRIKDLTPQWPKRYGYAVDLPKTKHFNIKVPVGILQLSGKNIIK